MAAISTRGHSAGDSRGEVLVRPTKSHFERVNVAVRIRPFLPHEGAGGSAAVYVAPGKPNAVVIPSQYDDRDLEFDAVLGPDRSQHEVYDHVALPIVQEVLDGYNGTILCYGQTGTGKTFTLGNADHANWKNPDTAGVIPRAASTLFERIAATPDCEYSVRVSYIQVYMEIISDLLTPTGAKLRIREDPDNGVFLSGVTEYPVRSVREVMHYVDMGNRHRATAFTNMNAVSSRSHALITITVEKRSKFKPSEHEDEFKELGGADATLKTIGQLRLVDLAGSECVKKSQSTGVRLKEAEAINLSLLALGNCVHALAELSKRRNRQSEGASALHVPFRDSKLTRLLQDALGGNCKTALIVTVGPASSNSHESFNSLKFGQRAMLVRQRAVVNEIADYKTMYIRLRSKVDELMDRINELEWELEQKTFENEELRRRLGIEGDADVGHSRKSDDLVRAHEEEKKRLLQFMKQKLEDEVGKLKQFHVREMERQKKRVLEEEAKKRSELEAALDAERAKMERVWAEYEKVKESLRDQVASLKRDMVGRDEVTRQQREADEARQEIERLRLENQNLRSQLDIASSGKKTVSSKSVSLESTERLAALYMRREERRMISSVFEHWKQVVEIHRESNWEWETMIHAQDTDRHSKARDVRANGASVRL